jgi:hypothetical protein
VGGFSVRVEKPVEPFLIGRSGVELASTAPTATRDDLTIRVVNEVRAVTDECLVDVRDIKRRARRCCLS